MPVPLWVLNLYPVCIQLVVHGILKMENMPHWVLRMDLSLASLLTSIVQDVPHFHTQNTPNEDFVAHPIQHWRPQVGVGMLLPYFLALS
jgi:branched-subunit amino acid permease